MPCTVKITGGKSDISLEKIHVKMLFDTEEKHVFLKSNSIGATVTIFGRINQARKESLVECLIGAAILLLTVFIVKLKSRKLKAPML